MVRKKLEKLKSLSFYLFVLFFLFGIVPVFVITAFLLETSKENQINAKMIEMQNQCLIMSGQLSKNEFLSNTDNGTLHAGLEQLADFYDGRVLVVDDNFVTIKDTYVVDEGKYNISEPIIRCMTGGGEASYSSAGRNIEITQLIYGTDNTEVKGVLFLSASVDHIDSLAEQLREKSHLLKVIIVILATCLSYGAAVCLVRPLRRLANSFSGTPDGSLESSVEINTYYETKEISEAYNKTLNRLKVLDDSRQQFVSNVSHELKTPITSVRVLADSLLAQENVPAELYREFMEDISKEIDRENRIIEDLLSLVRMDKTAKELQVENISMNEMMEALLKQLSPIAKKKDVELVLESYRPVVAEVDEMKMTLALSNLVENAIKYNIDGGWVRVTLNADHKFFYVKVQDNGIGIPEEDQQHIFERFYRVDKARSRETGGTGLGLAITQSIIYSHHGAIKVHSKEGEGTTFTVRVPLIYIA